ncbi:MAG: hypothetical protein V4805_06320, partial [Pseudomonadota bacterium]
RGRAHQVSCNFIGVHGLGGPYTLQIHLDGLLVNFRRIFGNARMDVVLGSVDGSVRFYGLTPTSMKLASLDRHRRLIDSYKKPHVARTDVAAPVNTSKASEN